MGNINLTSDEIKLLINMINEISFKGSVVEQVVELKEKLKVKEDKK